MKKVLHITPEIGQMSSGGIGTVSTNLYQQKTADDIFLFCTIWYENVPLPEIKEKIGECVLFCHAKDLSSKIEKINPDVIVFHALFLFRMYFENDMQNAIKKKIWVVFHNNPIMESGFKASIPEYSANYELVFTVHNANSICVSQYEKDLLTKMNKNKPTTKSIEVIYNGQYFSESFDFLERQECAYGYLGRLEERKGIFQLCKNFRQIDRKLLIATKNHTPGLMSMLSMSIDGNPKVIPLGWCVGDRLNSFYSQISSLIVPSIYEPFGMIFLEAGERMIPIIANKTPSAVEILGEDYPLFFNIADSSLLNVTDKFERMSYNQKRELAVSTKRRMMELFSIEKMAKQYRQLVDGGVN